jgi:acetoacetyl-CoA synthetase
VLRHAPYERVLGRRTMPGAEWFPGARLNYAGNLLHGSLGETVAIVYASESRDPGR